MKHRHRGEVIEVYNNGNDAAIKFTNGRIEHVIRRGFSPDFYIGMKGWVEYIPHVNGFFWDFTQFKSKE